MDSIQTGCPSSKRARFFRKRGAAFVAALVLIATMPSAPAANGRAVVLDIDGVIGPAIADYVKRELTVVSRNETHLVVLRMNTPGGLDTSMRAIIGAVLASPVPVATFVAPNGARAASAGTYIAYASAIAAMAPGTNIGAATPVQLGGSSFFPRGKPDQEKAKVGEPTDAETRKVVNDAVAYIRSLAEVNGRNANWAEDAVRTAASIPASEALKLHVVDLIADDIPDLLRRIDGRIVTIAGKQERLTTAGLDVVTIAPDWRTELLAVITNPNVAFILLLIGVYGIIFEFFSPGAVAPGLIGAISLLVALYALNLLPINYAGAGLVLLGMGTHDRRSAYRGLRRHRSRRHRRIRDWCGHDVPLGGTGVGALARGHCRRRRRDSQFLPARAFYAAAIAEAIRNHWQGGPAWRRGADHIVGWTGRSYSRRGGGLACTRQSISAARGPR